MFNFEITSTGSVSRAFLDRDINDFAAASAYIRDLPYGRNADKNDLLTVFSDGCATCSTKHALLKLLADEHEASQHPPSPVTRFAHEKVERGHSKVQLILCMFKMTAENTPSVKEILDRTGLPYMPEAHNFLRVNGELLDVTKKNWSIDRFPEASIEEHEIRPEQITDYKVAYQKAFMKRWLEEHPEIKYGLEALFVIREECIKAL